MKRKPNNQMSAPTGAIQFDPLDFAASVRHAIKRSISHTEIVETPVPTNGREEMLDYLEEQDEIDDLDSSAENDGSLDVWGKCESDDFRIRFSAPFNEDGNFQSGFGRKAARDEQPERPPNPFDMAEQMLAEKQI